MPRKKLLTYLYFSLLIIDALGIVYPDVLYRKYITFLPFPALFLLYVCSVKKVNWLYITSLIFTFLGIVFFNMKPYMNIALIFYGLGVCLYVVISLKSTVVIPIRSIFIATIPFLIIYLVPLILYYDAVQTDVFNYIMFYVFFVGLFFFISTLVYVSQRTTKNLWLLSSGVVFLISTIIHGYNMFFEPIITIRVGVVITFLFMHYAMYRYVTSE